MLSVLTPYTLTLLCTLTMNTVSPPGLAPTIDEAQTLPPHTIRLLLAEEEEECGDSDGDGECDSTWDTD